MAEFDIFLRIESRDELKLEAIFCILARSPMHVILFSSVGNLNCYMEQEETHCVLCDLVFPTTRQYIRHLSTKRHKNMEELKDILGEDQPRQLDFSDHESAVSMLSQRDDSDHLDAPVYSENDEECMLEDEKCCDTPLSDGKSC